MEKQYSQIPPPYYQDDEVTLKDIILTVKEYSKEVWRNVLWIILAIFLVGGIFYVRTHLQKITYTAGLTFMLREVNSSSSIGVPDFFAQNNSRKNGIKNNKITELTRSGRIIHHVLFNKIIIGNKNDFIANHLIDIYGFQGIWEKEPISEEHKQLHLKDFYFTNDAIENFQPKEYRALNLLHQLIAGNNISGQKGMMTITYNKLTDIFRLDVISLDGSASLKLVETIFQELREFYIEELVGRPKRNLQILEANADSILLELNKAEVAVARMSDQSQGLISKVSHLGAGRAARKLQTISRVYEEILSNKQRVEYIVNSETPDFQVIDRTFIPIKDAPSKLKALIMGGFLGSFLGIGFIIARKIIQDALKE